MLPIRLLLLAALSLPLAAPAMAQINPFPDTKGSFMNQTDLDAMTAASNRLNNRNPAVVGATETWTGDVSGTVRLDRIYRKQGMMCHAVSYKMKRTSNAMRSLRLNWCKVPSGEWKTDG